MQPSSDPLGGPSPVRRPPSTRSEFRQLVRRHRRRLERVLRIRALARVRLLFEAPGALSPCRMGRVRPVDPEADVPRTILWLLGRLEAQPVLDGATEPPVLRREGPRDEAPSELLVDLAVAELEPPVLREALILRDYCGAGWELLREELDLLSNETARELYRRAHDDLWRRLRSRIDHRDRAIREPR